MNSMPHLPVAGCLPPSAPSSRTHMPPQPKRAPAPPHNWRRSHHFAMQNANRGAVLPLIERHATLARIIIIGFG